MKFYIICPVCGAKLGKAEIIKNMDLQCAKYKEMLTVDISNEKLTVGLFSFYLRTFRFLYQLF